MGKHSKLAEDQMIIFLIVYQNLIIHLLLACSGQTLSRRESSGWLLFSADKFPQCHFLASQLPPLSPANQSALCFNELCTYCIHSCVVCVPHFLQADLSISHVCLLTSQTAHRCNVCTHTLHRSRTSCLWIWQTCLTSWKRQMTVCILLETGCAPQRGLQCELPNKRLTASRSGICVSQ